MGDLGINSIILEHGNKKHGVLHELRKNWQAYLMLVIPIAYVLIFSYLPMVGVTIAFKDFSFRKGILGSKWVGLKHFKQFLGNPAFFNTILRNTVIISIYSFFVNLFVPIILALTLNEVGNKFFKKTVQMVTYAPYFISVTVMVGMLLQILHPNVGLVNRLVKSLGGRAVDYMGRASYFRHLYVWSGVWQSAGYNAIIYLASLSGIDQEAVEASIIDGANRIQRIIHIDIPTIMPTITILLILSIGQIMNVGFEKIYLMQNPVNLEVSEVISTLVYKQGLEMAQMSYSTAVGLFNSIVNFILIITANSITRKASETSLW